MPSPNPLLLTALLAVIFLPILMTPAVLVMAARLGRRTSWVAMAAPLAAIGLLAWLAIESGPRPQVLVEAPWIPMLGLNLSFLLDGLSLLYGFIICVIGVLVCWYAGEYLGEKCAHGRFYASLLLFMSAMLGTVFSDNLLLLFIFWEITGVASFLLIGFFHEKEASRLGARQALLVTAATGLCLLAGLILLKQATGTFSLSAIYAAGLPHDARWIEATCVLLLLGAFGKSAQFPFQFWLPGAMAAPTPVSTYLHSATMVKLGVFLTARLFPLFQSLELWFWLVCGVGFFTMLLGAWLALRSHDLKAILAYSTVSQLGALIGAYGLGARTGVQADYVHILSHVFYKGSLFMTAGIAEHCAGTRDVRRLGGLGRVIPLTAVTAAIGTASLAGVPLTTGFLSKEILLTDLGVAGAWLGFAAVTLSATFTVAFAARLFFGVYCGQRPAGSSAERQGWSVQIPPLLLALAALGFGMFPGALDGLVNGLKVPGLHNSDPVHLSLWHGFTRELLATGVIFLAGAWIYRHSKKTGWKAEIPVWLRFDLAFEHGLNGLTVLSKKLTLALRADWPPAYLPILISFLLAALAAAAAFSPDQFFAGFAGLEWNFDPLRSLVAVMVVIALLGVVFLRRWTTQLIALSGAGFLLTFYFVLYRAPDLAMTQILVESASVIMILLLLSRFPSSQLQIRADTRQGVKRVFQIVLSAGMGVAVFLLMIFAGLHRHADPIGPRLLALSEPIAEGTNAVNTILVDFRGFDTLGEITVLLIATLGALGLMMRYKRRNATNDPSPPPGFFLQNKRKS